MGAVPENLPGVKAVGGGRLAGGGMETQAGARADDGGNRGEGDKQAVAFAHRALEAIPLLGGDAAQGPRLGFPQIEEEEPEIRIAHEQVGGLERLEDRALAPDPEQAGAQGCRAASGIEAVEGVDQGGEDTGFAGAEEEAVLQSGESEGGGGRPAALGHGALEQAPAEIVIETGMAGGPERPLVLAGGEGAERFQLQSPGPGGGGRRRMGMRRRRTTMRIKMMGMGGGDRGRRADGKEGRRRGIRRSTCLDSHTLSKQMFT